MGQRAGRATAVAVTVVTAAAVLAGCGRLESRRHAFPDSLHQPTPTTTATAAANPTPTATPVSPARSPDTSRDPFGEVARKVGGKFVHFPSTHEAFAQFDAYDELADPMSLAAGLSRLRRLPAEVQGKRSVIPVTGRSGGQDVTVHLSVDDGLVPVRYSVSGVDISLEYGEFGAPVTVVALPRGEVVEADELSGDVRLPRA